MNLTERKFRLLQCAIKASDDRGLFTRRGTVKVFNALHRKNSSTYTDFDRMVEDGDFIKQKFGFFSLPDEVKKAVGKKSDPSTDKSLATKETANRAIAYLNELTDSSFRVGKTVESQVSARLREGYKSQDFIKVIDIKFNEWRGTKMATYLRPSTLFGTKFGEYLNQVKAEHKTDKILEYDFSKYFS